MAKPIQETIFKSRLTITYRTNITGTPTQESLPYRLLVLGDFSGRGTQADGGSRASANVGPDLRKREVKSIKRGTTLDDHLSEQVPAFRIPDGDAFKSLRSKIPGHVSGLPDQKAVLLCNVPASAIAAKDTAHDETATYKLSGAVRFSSKVAENGLCDLEGELQVGGTMTVTIKGNAKEEGTVAPVSADVYVYGVLRGAYNDPATKKVAGIVSAAVDQHITLDDKSTVKIANFKPADDGDTATPQPAGFKVFRFEFAEVKVDADRTVPFPSLEAFTPDAIASSIPELHRLQVIKQLLTDLQSGLRNRPQLSKFVKSLLPAYGADDTTRQDKLKPFVALKEWATSAYPLLQLEPPATPAKKSN